MDKFDEDHTNATQEHFLHRVCGVFTRDGRPESIFLKHVGVKFIEKMSGDEANTLYHLQTSLLHRAVDFIDAVAVPQNALKTSRQGCIVDVKARFLIRRPRKEDPDLARLAGQIGDPTQAKRPTA